MKAKFQIESIGEVKIENNTYSIMLDQKYIPGLKNLEGFSHLQIVWWAHLTDNLHDRGRLVLPKLFKHGPDTIGVFATRSPIRPNPILFSTIKIQEINIDKGEIFTPFIDAEDRTPVLDIKPYFSMERVRDCTEPTWCQHWPKWFEDSGKFDWRNEIVSH
ncbi:MAG TPA: TrmO family methyltransferase [Anaerolineaceae bacterium]|nr:TrmO family methyltransferase [Anaerolineaceae bacterium]